MPDKNDTMPFDKPTPRSSPSTGSSAPRSPRNQGKSKKRNQQLFLRTFIYAMIVIVVSLLLALFAIGVANDALALVKPGGEFEVTIEKGTSLKDIASSLKDANIIKYPFAFQIFAAVTGTNSKFQYGTYLLGSDMDYLELATKLQKSAVQKETATVTITEGKELREIAAILQEKGVCSSADFLNIVETGTFDYKFLEGLPKRENRLEGYLFPDTYEFFKDEDPTVVVKKFLNNFDKKFKEEYYTRAKEMDMTVDEVITLASIVEREAAGDEDRDKVASVFHNRLNGKNYPLLQSCATVQYILKDRKPVLSVADTKIDSPYNTYLNKGLPVGPIASPGLKSIEATLYPAKTDFLFFVVDSDGNHIFSKTLEQHRAAAKKSNTSKGTGTVEQ